MRITYDENGEAYIDHPVMKMLAGKVTELQQALAEREATIAAVAATRREVAQRPRHDASVVFIEYDSHALDKILSAAPGDALRAHDAEVWMEAYELMSGLVGRRNARELFDRAEAIRELEGEQ